MSGIFWVLIVIAVLMFVSCCLIYDIARATAVSTKLTNDVKQNIRSLRSQVHRIEEVIKRRDFTDERAFSERIKPYFKDE